MASSGRDAGESAKVPAMARDEPVQPATEGEKSKTHLSTALHPASREPPPPDVILRARGIRKHFGGIRAVDGMDIDVPQGALVGLIGPNGAGKSTFFNLLTGFTKEDAGETWFQGRRIDAIPMHKRARLGLVRTFQITRTLQRMTVLENLMLAPKAQTGETLLGAFAFWKVREQEREVEERAHKMLEYFRLSHLTHEYAGALSGGQKKLLELARALMLEPRMLLLDEPMAGVNPTLAAELMERIQELRRTRGMTFLLVEHDMETVFTHCDPIVVMAEGRKLAEGDAESVRNNKAVQDAYLGG